MNDYEAVIQLLTPVLGRGRSFDAGRCPGASPLAREIAYGVLRQYFRLQAIVNLLVKKPLADKHLDIRLLIYAGLYSIDMLKRPAHASVNAAVESVADIGKPWAKGLVNGVLRNYLRNLTDIEGKISQNNEAVTGHPDWLHELICRDWPADNEAIIAANNQQAPMTLRVNQRRIDRAGYERELGSADIQSRVGELATTALYLDAPVSVNRLPGFGEGKVSIQDEVSQLAATVLDPEPGNHVLDACAAPGGKTCHLLEAQPDMQLTALDVDGGRVEQIQENLARLELECELVTADLSKWNPADRIFDRILLDAPCSGTGVIRRHPDIKLLRRKSDVGKLANTQLTLLRAAWRLLKGGGVLVYSTCSVLKAENDDVIGRFLDTTSNVSVTRMEAPWGTATRFGRQLLPTPDRHDGFYYARLVKPANS